MRIEKYLYENVPYVNRTQVVRFDSEEDVKDYADGKEYYFESDGGYNGSNYEFVPEYPCVTMVERHANPSNIDEDYYVICDFDKYVNDFINDYREEMNIVKEKVSMKS